MTKVNYLQETLYLLEKHLAAAGLMELLREHLTNLRERMEKDYGLTPKEEPS